MADSSLIKKYLPEELWQIATDFSIPDEFLKELPELVEMILRSRSIDTHEEKQNRFNLLPLMNDSQIEKLRAILLKEKKKLQQIEEKYETKKKEIKKKYLMKWQEMGYVQKVSEIKNQEAQHREQEHEEAEELLDLI